MLRLAEFLKARKMTKVDLATAQSQLPQLVAQALAGDVVVITGTSAGEVRLMPLDLQGRPILRQPGAYKGQIIMSDDFDEPLEDFAEYM